MSRELVKETAVNKYIPGENGVRRHRSLYFHERTFAGPGFAQLKEDIIVLRPQMLKRFPTASLADLSRLGDGLVLTPRLLRVTLLLLPLRVLKLSACRPGF